MTDTIISLRIDKEILKKMRKYDEINWSAYLRNCLNQKIENIGNIDDNDSYEDSDNFDKEKARKASESMDKIRASGIFNGGKTGVEIIREWRDKRK